MTDTKTLEDEITRLNSCLQYEQHRSNRISTHGPACATWGPNHYECALRDLSAARAEIERLKEVHLKGCECSTDDACRFARERDDARAELSVARERMGAMRDWLVSHGLLQLEFCTPASAVMTGYWWVLHCPAGILGGGLAGYGKTQDEAIDAALAQGGEPKV